MRLVIASVAITAAAVGASPMAVADDVPELTMTPCGAACDNWDRYIFGRGPSGQPLACVAFDGDGQWVRSMPLVRPRDVCVADQCWQPGP